MRAQKRSVEHSGPKVMSAHFELNRWHFLWALAGAWMWYGILHLSNIL